MSTKPGRRARPAAHDRRGDAIAVDGDVATMAGRAGPVDDLGVPDQDVKHTGSL
jgi:hypothetical protein